MNFKHVCINLVKLSTNRQTKMQFDRFNCDDVFFIYLNLLYLQIKNSVLTFHFFKIIKENEKKSNWIVVSNLGFPLKSTMLS